MSPILEIYREVEAPAVRARAELAIIGTKRERHSRISEMTGLASFADDFGSARIAYWTQR